MKMEFDTCPEVCSEKIILSIAEDGTIEEVKFIGGCPGNLSGIGRLVKGKQASEIASLLEGVTCGGKSTSCPDQLSKALKKYLSTRKAEK